ncbi:MAG TPA: hypothetical protein VI566_10345 [Xanthomonadales bacterium]|nr:hypothetical protein [Xanthomonadales bacterium]
MKAVINKLPLLGLPFIAGLLISFNVLAEECFELENGDKVKYEGCTVKVNCKAEEAEDDVECGAEICFYGEPPESYEASYEFWEEETWVCGGYVGAQLEDAPDTKYTCENDAEFTFKVECPHEEDDE